MKVNIFKNIAVLLLILVTATNCTDELKELNVNPTTATASNFDPNFLLSSAQLYYTGSQDFSYETWRTQLIYFSTMTQHLATTIPYWVGDKYLINPGYAASYFERAYDEQVRFVVDALELSKDKPEYANLYQILRIWKVVVFHRLTDIYGDVPYFEAGRAYYDRVFSPAYDEQEAIYADMLKELDEAAAALDPSLDAPRGDMVYNGDVNKWKKFAYSMMIRLGMRMTKVDEAAAKQWVEAGIAGGPMTDINDNAYILHDVALGRPTVNRISNVFNENAGERANVKWSKTFIDYLANTNDPRLPVLAEIPPVAAGEPNHTFGLSGNNDPAAQIGMPNGYDIGNPVDITTEPNYPGAVGADPLGNYSRPRNPILFKLDGPTFIMTLAEVELMLAEAAHRSWTVPGTAEEHYNAGVRAAMESLQQFDAAAAIASGDIDAYLAANPYDPANGLEMINTQYWVATVFNEYETFANWRRSGFPVLTPVDHPNGQTGGVIPRRLIYPVAEAADNPTNYEAALSRMGGSDSMLEKVWWDQ